MLDENGTKQDLRARFPTDRRSYTSYYDYEDDSDLEEDDDEPADSPQAMTEEPRNSSDVIVLDNSDAKSSESSDVVSVSDLDSLFYESSDTKGETRTASSHVGKVVVIEDVAFVT